MYLLKQVGVRCVNNSSNLNRQLYIVTQGRKPGVYETWAECFLQVNKFPAAEFKKLKGMEDTKKYLKKCLIFLGNEKKSKNVANKEKILGSMLEYCQNDVTESRSFETPGSGVPYNPKEVLRSESKITHKKKTLTDLEKEHDIAYLREEDEKFIQIHFDALANANANIENIIGPCENVFEQVDSRSQTGCCNVFDVVDGDRVSVYTDGSCKNNGLENPAAGIGVYFGPENSYNVSEPIEGLATNNRAEIIAANVAIERALIAGFSKVKINTDSNYVIQGATNWFETWVSNDGKSAKGKSIVNWEEWEDLMETCKRADVIWEFIKGHGDSEGNIAADTLAQAGADRYLKPQS